MRVRNRHVSLIESYRRYPIIIRSNAIQLCIYHIYIFPPIEKKVVSHQRFVPIYMEGEGEGAEKFGANKARAVGRKKRLEKQESYSGR